jgi:uncharacterized protein DUF1905
MLPVPVVVAEQADHGVVSLKRQPPMGGDETPAQSTRVWGRVRMHGPVGGTGRRHRGEPRPAWKRGRVVRFRAIIRLGGKTATGIPVPPEVVAALDRGQRPAVRVTIAGHSYRSTVAVMGGEFMLPSAPKTEPAPESLPVDVDIELDTEPREVRVPPTRSSSTLRPSNPSTSCPTATSSAVSCPSKVPRQPRPGSGASPKRSARYSRVVPNADIDSTPDTEQYARAGWQRRARTHAFCCRAGQGTPGARAHRPALSAGQLHDPDGSPKTASYRSSAKSRICSMSRTRSAAVSAIGVTFSVVTPEARSAASRFRM